MDMSQSADGGIEFANSTEIHLSLEELNAEEAKRNVGGAVFVGILMIVGTIGNVHVLAIYATKFKSTNHRTFILCLAAVDTVTCLVGMPFVIYDLMHPVMFFLPTACKIMKFVNYFMCTSSGMLLLVIAVERYRKICKPLSRQMTPNLANVICGVSFLLALAISWPALVLYGHSTERTRIANVTGVRCFTEDRFKNIKFQAYFNLVLMVTVGAGLIVLSVLYSLIGKQVWRQTASTRKSHFRHNPVIFSLSVVSASKKNENNSFDTRGIQGQPSSDMSSTAQEPIPLSTSNNAISNDENTFNPKRDRSAIREKMSKDFPDKRKEQIKRTTFTLFLITVVSFCSFMPHLTLRIVRFLEKDFVSNMTVTESFVYNTFIWCFFVNSMVNPIIYGFCDVRYRKKLAKAYSSCFGNC